MSNGLGYGSGTMKKAARHVCSCEVEVVKRSSLRGAPDAELNFWSRVASYTIRNLVDSAPRTHSSRNLSAGFLSIHVITHPKTAKSRS
jgi:hypothetical protein